MPLAKLTCPECKAVLKPAKPVQEGKTVKCPKCEANFTAGGDNAEPPAEGKTHAKTEQAARKKATDVDNEEDSAGVYGVVETDADRKKKEPPKRKRRRSDDDEDDEDEDEEEDAGSDAVKELLRNLKTADPRGPAQEIIVKPSNWLLRIGGVGFFSWVGCFIVFLIPIVFPPPPDKPDENAVAPVEKKEEKPGEKPPGPSMKAIAGRTLFRVIFLTCFFFPGILQGGLIAYGAAKMQSMESRGWGIAAAIIAIFPLHSLPLFWLVTFLMALLAIFLDMVPIWGLVFAAFLLIWGPAYGIWSLIQFLKPEVQLGFDYKPKD
jgi:hypothetical protein